MTDGRRRIGAGLLALFALSVLAGVVPGSPRASSESRLPQLDLSQTGKVHPELYSLVRGDAPFDPRSQRVAGAVEGADPELVTVAAVPTTSGHELLSDLEQIGLQDGLAVENLVTGRLPLAAVDAAGELDSLRFVRPEWTVASTGSVTSQGDAAMKADAARTALNLTGAGVIVGTLSDSFDCENGYTDDVADGELPSGIEVLAEGPCADVEVPPTDEGRAMMQIISDVAPGATQKFHTARNGQLDYAQGIVDLKNAGADVITDDYAYLNEPWFQDGVISQAIDAVTAEGVSYFAAAGNAGRQGYESRYREATYTPKGYAPAAAHDFDPGTGSDTAQRVTVPPRSFVRVALQWDDNFKTQVPSTDAPKTDLDIAAFTPGGDLLPLPGFPGSESGLSALPGALAQAISLEPVEVMLLLNVSSDPKPVDFVILRDSGPPTGLLKWIGISLEPLVVTDFPSTPGNSIFGHSQALGAMSVGAASALQTATVPVIESFSSTGGGAVSRDPKGAALGAAATRAKPNFVGPDDVNTSFFGADSPDDTDTLPNFAGTSAAAPHVAAVAALALEKSPTSTRDDICNALSSTAIDMGSTTGADNESGHGFVDAHAMLDALPLSATAIRSARCSTVQLVIDSVTIAEGNSGTTKLSFKVTKLGATTLPVTVDYATTDGTATEVDDYRETSGTLTFAPTDLTKTIDVEIVGDTSKESDETFVVTLANATPANVVALNTTSGTATIDDDDTPTTPGAGGTDGEKLDRVAFGKPSKSTVEPGDEVKIAGSGFEARASLALSFHSTPVALGSATAAKSGTFSATITIPASATSGAHEIHAVGIDAGGGTRTIRYPITIVNGAASSSGTGMGSTGNEVVGSITTTSTLPGTMSSMSPSTLPRTGGGIAVLAQLGTLLVMIGAFAVYGTRRGPQPARIGFDLSDLR